MRIFRSRKSKELMVISKEPYIFKEIKGCSLRWTEDVQRLPNQRLVKLAWESNPKGRRLLGRPRIREGHSQGNSDRSE